MSTRSIVAEPHGDTWRGRYIHSDGYPAGVGADLWRLVQRDGLAVARQTLLHDHYGWAGLAPTIPDPATLAATPVPPRDQFPPYGTPAWFALVLDAERGIYGNPRYTPVTGYGIAYTTFNGEASPDDWFGPGATGWCEWGYVLTDGGLLVGRVTGDDLTPLDLFRWDRPAPDWGLVQAAVSA